MNAHTGTVYACSCGRVYVVNSFMPVPHSSRAEMDSGEYAQCTRVHYAALPEVQAAFQLGGYSALTDELKKHAVAHARVQAGRGW